MEISSDYKNLFKILNKYKVRYLIVGAYAAVYYLDLEKIDSCEIDYAFFS